MSEPVFKRYRQTYISDLAQWAPGMDMVGVTIVEEDLRNGSPKVGDMIGRNPNNHADRWLVSARYFAEYFDPNPI